MKKKTDPQLRVLFVLEHYYPYIGGAEKLFCNLAEALAETGCTVKVVTTQFNETLPKHEWVNGVEVVRIRCFNRYLFTFLSLPKVLRLARKCDLVHTTTYNAALPAWLGARLAQKPIIVTFHEVWGKLWFRLPFASTMAKRAYYLYERLILQLGFDHFVAVSDFTHKALEQAGIPPGRISRIYNGLDYEQFEPYQHNPPEHFTFAYFGRLGISKGLNLLLPASRMFFDKHPESRLVLIIPKQPKGMFHQITNLIGDLGLEKNIELKHELSKQELYQTICASSAVVIPSYSEGFCFVAAETVGLGVPIISSGEGSLKEVVSGKVVECEKLTVEGVFNALCRAHLGDWRNVPPRKFLFQEAVMAYQELYEIVQ